MSRHRFEIEVEVNDKMLAAHDGKSWPPPNDPSDWEPSDLFDAALAGIVMIADCEFTDYTRLPPEE